MEFVREIAAALNKHEDKDIEIEYTVPDTTDINIFVDEENNNEKIIQYMR